MAAVSPAGPDPMINTWCRSGSPGFVTFDIDNSILQRVRLQRGLAILDVHAELHLLDARTSHEFIPGLTQGLLELFIGEAVHVLATLLLQLHELLVDVAPLGGLGIGRAPTREFTGRGRS